MTGNEEMYEALNNVKKICQKTNCSECPCMGLYCEFLVKPYEWEFDLINPPVYKMRGKSHDR